MMPPVKHLYVVIRLDEPVDPLNWKQAFKLLSVFNDRDGAEREAERLRFINGPEKCAYQVHTARSALEN